MRARAFAQIVGGGTPKNASDAANYDEDGTPWLTPADLSGYRRATIARGKRTLSAAGLKVSSARLLPPGAVLISSRAPVGYCAVAEKAMTTNQGFRSLVCDESVDPFFIRYYTLFSRRYLEENARGTTFKELSGSALGELLFPIPPIDVQRRIVTRIDELFSELDDGEEELARARADLETYRKSLLKSAVTGELTADWRRQNPSPATGADLLHSILEDRQQSWHACEQNRGKRYKQPTAPDTESLPSLPPDWTWASLDQLSWGSAYGTSQKCAADGKGEPVLRIPNLKAGGVDLTELKHALAQLALPAEEYVAPGDLLIVRTNGSEQLIGRTGILSSPLPAPTHYASYLIRFRMTGGPERWRWIRAFTESPVFRSSVLTSIGSSAGQYNLSMSKLASFPIAVPPDREVGEILRRWSAAEIEWDDAWSAEITKLRQSILAAAFRGELS